MTYYGIDEIGHKYNRLTVIAFKDNDAHPTNHWICLCDCGNVVTVGGRELRSGRTKSCGCLNNEKRRERAGKFGVATEAHKLPKGFSSFRMAYRRYQHSAKLRNIEWNLSEDDAYNFMRMDCFYCGAPPGLISGSDLNNGLFVHSGLDRFDNNKCYDIDNVVPCCKICNKAKLDMTAEDFIQWLLRASEYLRENIIHARY